jgi:hypothetical protein
MAAGVVVGVPLILLDASVPMVYAAAVITIVAALWRLERPVSGRSARRRNR